MSFRRIWALVRRHYYLHQGSWPRLLELIHWPLMELLLWGFLAIYLRGAGSDLPLIVPMLLGALILWDVLYRSQIGVALVFLEEIWSRNLANLFVSPLTPLEFIIAQITVGIIRTIIAVASMSVLAIVLYDYNFFTLGLPLVAFFTNLIIMGWAIGLMVTGLILRFGQGAESLAWAIIFLFQPIAAVFYPVSVLPEWLQTVAYATPAANVFEGMRAVIQYGTFETALFIKALWLNGIYLGVGIGFFLLMFQLVRRDGQLLQMGE